ncbi:MAG: serine/threonine protein kinase [Archangiaceae bacterium]|nr:serine/threonine protein kinase [Archangiaceae bacterium]
MADDAPQGPPQIDASELLGKTLDGRYRLDSLLGYGGMGMVFRATQTTVGREVAVKTLNPSLAMAPQFFERFKREAEVASRLKHPNIVTIFDFGKSADGICYIAMELLEGESLRQMVKRQGPMSLRRAAASVEQIALGLQNAHNHGVVHRDMKPHNVLVSSIDGAEYLKVLDFGLVKANESEDEEQLTSTGQVLGTPQYMAPEQASGEPVDARTDLYALGAVFHYCLTGQSPYNANSVRKALTAALTQPLPTVASKRRGAPVPQAIEEFLRKALAPEAADRYQNAEEFIADLEASLQGVSDAVLDALPEPLPGQEAERKESSASSAGKRGSKSGVGKSGVGNRSRSSRPLPKSEADKILQARERERVTQGEIPSLKEGSSTRSSVPLAVKLALVILPIAGVAGAGVAFFVKPKDPLPLPAHVSDTAVPPQPDKAVVAAPTEKPAAGDEVTVTFKSTPAGAAVMENGVMIGKTPLEQRWARNSVKNITFQLSGYKDLKGAYKLQGDQTFEVELEPASRKQTGKGGKKTRGGGGDIDAFE